MDLDPQRRCPLCGEDNRCAVAAASADPAAACWCRDQSFSDEVLASVPDAVRGSVCLCQRHTNPE